MAAGIADGGGRRAFGRSLAFRAVTLLALVLFGTAAAARVAAGGSDAGLAAIAGLALLALFGAVSGWGDRFTLDAEGIEYRNAFLGRLLSRRLAWRDIVRVHDHRSPGAGPEARPRALFLVPRSGRRLVLDSLEDFDAVRGLVALAVAQAAEAAEAAPPGTGGSGSQTALSTPPADRPR